MGKAALLALALTAAASPLLAQKTDVITLVNGDRVTGATINVSGGWLMY